MHSTRSALQLLWNQKWPFIQWPATPMGRSVYGPLLRPSKQPEEWSGRTPLEEDLQKGSTSSYWSFPGLDLSQSGLRPLTRCFHLDEPSGPVHMAHLTIDAQLVGHHDTLLDLYVSEMGCSRSRSIIFSLFGFVLVFKWQKIDSIHLVNSVCIQVWAVSDLELIYVQT